MWEGVNILLALTMLVISAAVLALALDAPVSRAGDRRGNGFAGSCGTINLVRGRDFFARDGREGP